MGALSDLVTQGKVRYIGSSTSPAWKIMESLHISELRKYPYFISEQSPYNLLDRRIENELVPFCKHNNLGIIAWSPLAMGLLAGRYTNAKKMPKDSRGSIRKGIYSERITESGISIGKKFVKLAQKNNIKPVQLATLWVKDQPGVTLPLIGPKTLKQLTDYLPVLDMKLNKSIIKLITLEFIGVTLRLVQTLGNLNNSLNALINSQVHIEKLMEFESDKEIMLSPLVVDKNMKESVAIKVENVNFKYFGSTAVSYTHLTLPTKA